MQVRLPWRWRIEIDVWRPIDERGAFRRAAAGHARDAGDAAGTTDAMQQAAA